MFLSVLSFILFQLLFLLLVITCSRMKKPKHGKKNNHRPANIVPIDDHLTANSPPLTAINETTPKVSRNKSKPKKHLDEELSFQLPSSVTHDVNSCETHQKEPIGGPFSKTTSMVSKSRSSTPYHQRTTASTSCKSVRGLSEQEKKKTLTLLARIKRRKASRQGKEPLQTGIGHGTAVSFDEEDFHEDVQQNNASNDICAAIDQMSFHPSIIEPPINISAALQANTSVPQGNISAPKVNACIQPTSHTDKTQASATQTPQLSNNSRQSMQTPMENQQRPAMFSSR